MKNKTLFLVATTLSFLLPNFAKAQFSFSGQYMNRAEYRQGYGNLSTKNQLPAFFISQRARVGATYFADKYDVVVSAQDIRTWGNTSNAAIDVSGMFSICEAYGNLKFNKHLNLKLGRQMIAYDDQRIFGNSDWNMQSRRHDAAILQYQDSSFSTHFGAAYNANAETNSFAQYSVANNYQNFQYLWLNKLHGKFNSSFLFLNNGVVATDKLIAYSQTVGGRTTFKNNKEGNERWGATAHFYYQLGQDAKRKNLNAFNGLSELYYKPINSLKVTLGGEFLSGTSQTDSSAKYKKQNHSFNPLYGTNHGFNGYMDYFYVGNHVNSTGLLDVYLRVSYVKNKFLGAINVHHFNSAAPIKDVSNINSVTKLNSKLGTEVDLTFGYNIFDNVALQIGYSQMFGSSSLVALRGGQLAQISNWAYASILMRPGKDKWPKTGLKL